MLPSVSLDPIQPQGAGCFQLQHRHIGDEVDSTDFGWVQSIFSSKDEPEDGGWGFLRSWGSFLVFGFDLGTGE